MTSKESPEVNCAMRIYIASKILHAYRWRELRAKGFNIISTWIDETEANGVQDPCDLAQRCINEAKSADRVILYCETGDFLKGTLMEVGAALSVGVPVYVVGNCESINSIFTEHPLWHKCDHISQALCR